MGDGDDRTLVVSGELDLETAPALARRLADELRATPRRLLVDLSSVVFCGARGIGVLAEAADRAAALGTSVRLVRASRPVRRALGASSTRRMLT